MTSLTFALSCSPFQKARFFRRGTVGTAAIVGFLTFVGASTAGAQPFLEARPFPASQTPTNAASAPIGWQNRANASKNVAPKVSPNVSEKTTNGVSKNDVSASEIWSNFLFGTPDANGARRRATMKFAFSPNPSNETNDVAPSQRRAVASAANAVPNLSNEAAKRETNAAETASPPDISVADARRRRLLELNAILAAKRPDEFTRRRLDSTTFDVANAPLNEPSQLVRNERLPNGATPTTSTVRDVASERLAELRRVGSEAPNGAESAVVSVPFDAAQENRSKIRQASHLELTPGNALGSDDFNDDALGFAYLPVRPNALQIAPRVFLSSEIVALPTSGPVESESTSAPESNSLDTSSATALKSPPNIKKESAQPSVLPTIPTAINAVSVESTAVGRPLFRPASGFVDPKTVPDRH